MINNIIRKILELLRRESNSIVITASVPNMGDFKFHVHRAYDKYISGDLIRDNIWEPFETEVFRRLCKPGDFVVDIGANIGWYSVIASRLLGSSGRVLSIEPDSSNLQLLRTNLALSGGMAQSDIMNAALGDLETESRLYLSENNLGDHRLFDDGKPRDSITVHVQTLDNLFTGNSPKPTLIKSDTQGSEAKILRGAKRLLAEEWRPVLILEFWPFGLTNSGDDPILLWEELSSLGYDMYEVSEDAKKLIGLSGDEIRMRVTDDLSPDSQRFLNLLCLPMKSERYKDLKDLIGKE